MGFIRFFMPNMGTRLGLVQKEIVTDITFLGGKKFSSIIDLVDDANRENMNVSDFLREKTGDETFKQFSYKDLDVSPTIDIPHLLTPIEPNEVWGSGVTYLRSRDAREYETKVKDIYTRVYDAKRPELFLKATSSRCVGPNEPICIRSDSVWTVPEPELAFVVGSSGEIIGYTIGNDVSARDIEGENPLYIPQAKIHKGCCALGPMITISENVGDPGNLKIMMKILRDSETVFQGEINTSKMKRSNRELLEYLHRDNPIPTGTVCLTGTGIVPPDDFSLSNGDIVEIDIDNIGTLRNPVLQLQTNTK